MKPESIIVLVVTLYNLSDAQNIPNKPTGSLNYKGSRKLPEDRKKLSLFPKISKKFVFTPSPDEGPKYTTPNPKNLEKKRLMPKIVPEYRKENIIPAYRVPITRRPLMKIKKFTLDPYIQQQSNEVKNNRNNRLDFNSYDTSRSNENEDTIVSVENLDSGEEYDDGDDTGTLNNNNSIEEVDRNDDITTINTENLNSYEENHITTENTLENHGNMDDDKIIFIPKYPGRYKQFETTNGEINNSETFINSSENREDENSDEKKYDSGSMENDQEDDTFRTVVSTENVSDEDVVISSEDSSKEIDNSSETITECLTKIYNLSATTTEGLTKIENSSETTTEGLTEIDNSFETTNGVLTTLNEEFDYTTEKDSVEEVLNINGLQYDQSTFATFDPYIDSYTVVDRSTLNDKISVTQTTIMEETTEEFVEILTNVETTQSVLDLIGSRAKRHVNIIEEENLGTTVAGFKFTGREPVLHSHLAYKNINT